MGREFHVRFREGLGVRFPRATRLVICCKPGNAGEAMAAMRGMMGKLKLTVHERKTRQCSVPGETFTFLGFTFGRQVSWKTGRA
jgi:RNA-directed DNA polymerase